MSEWLEEIKRYFTELSDFTTLVFHRGKVMALISELEKCREENAEFNHVFDFQRDRLAKAEKMWQKATGKHDTMPDLGVLLDWLMAEIKELEKRIDDWRGAVSGETDRGMEWKDKAEKAEAEIKRLKAILADMGIYF